MFVREVEDVEVDTLVKLIDLNCFCIQSVEEQDLRKTLNLCDHLASSASMTVGRCVGLEGLIILAFGRWQKVL